LDESNVTYSRRSGRQKNSATVMI